MNAGMSEEHFRQLAATTARLGMENGDEPIAVVRCENGWRTLYPDGSSHPGRPVSRTVMGELGIMADQHRADEEELRRLAKLWAAIEDEFGEATAAESHDDAASGHDASPGSATEPVSAAEAAVAAENRAAALASERIIDVEALEDSLIEEPATASELPRLELGEFRDAARSHNDDPARSAASTAGPGGAPAGGHPEAQWRSSNTFVPWSVVEAMVDVELDSFFRKRRAS